MILMKIETLYHAGELQVQERVGMQSATLGRDESRLQTKLSNIQQSKGGRPMLTTLSQPIAIEIQELATTWQKPVSELPVEDQTIRNPIISNTGRQERKLVQALRQGNEAAIGSLIERYHNRLVRLAQSFVNSQAVAEEVVQDTWLAVLQSIDRFEGRSSLKTWIFRILTNIAKSRGRRENRYVSFISEDQGPDTETNFSLGRKRFPTDEFLGNHSTCQLTTWDDKTPDRLLESKEILAQIEKAIQTLPSNQRQVIILRDIEGVDSEEICQILNITSTNQRVLLHRARSKVRWALNPYLQGNSPTMTAPSIGLALMSNE